MAKETDDSRSQTGQEPERQEPRARKSQTGPKAKAIIAGIIAVLCLVVFFQNLAPVQVQLFFWPISMALIALMLLMVFIGFVLGWIVAALRDKPKSAD